MNAKLRAIRKVREARRRLRDHAAAATVAAEQHLTQAAEDRELAEDGLERIIDGANSRLVERPNATVLMLFDDERTRAVRNIDHAGEAVLTAQGESEKARNALRLRERDLRSSEKLMDRMRAEQEATLARGEQRLADDLSATRLRRDK